MPTERAEAWHSTAVIRPRVHPAWIVLGALAFAMLGGTGLRSVFGVYIKPMEAEFGWSRVALSGAAAVSLLVYGAVGPLAGRLADSWGPRRVITLSLALLGIGTVGSAFVHRLWHLYVTTGLLTAVGAGATQPAGAAVVARWFEARRGLALGIVGGAMSGSQLIVIPLATALTLTLGWRASLIGLGVGMLILVLPIGAALIRNDPEERGLRPYGATRQVRPAHDAAPLQREARVSVTDAARVSQFWLLMATYFVCGYTSMGMILTHFIPHALEHGFTAIEASTALGVMGAMNLVGAIASGWICDRVGRRGPLATYYFVRGLSLVFLLYVWNIPTLHLWAAIFGLNYISTIPPTTSLTATIFGRYSVGELMGWISFSHQVGAALGAALAGWVFEWTGSYSGAFVSAAILAFVASALVFAIREEPIVSRPTPAPAPA
jgi:MFS family permease